MTGIAGVRLDRLDLGTWSGNHAMCGAARSAGLLEEARFREARVVRGQRHDSAYFGILRAGCAGPAVAGP